MADATAGGYRLRDQVAMVTGAGSGNGKAIALRLAAEGACLALTDIAEAPLHGVRDQVTAMGRPCLALVSDVADVAGTDAAIRQAVDRFGRLDVLVNNAGIIRISPFPDTSEEDWDRTMAVNARGLYFAMQAAARVMRAQRSGRIINIASVAGIEAKTLAPPYAASKGAVITLTKAAARAMASFQVTVNAVAPGLIDTPFNERIDYELGVKRGLAPGEFLRQRAQDIPLGRIGTPEDVAGVVAFLASPDAAYITGETVIVAGGWLMA
jgi:meso-butanediol dehydrogenase/(S,S)-butanediol dehydrogenase/diacetyl reductase